ncbi:MAG: FKBP-type peptidyl-prolyl cis-trans isomerase [Clostridia bacterium]|nr:FKBP-type peptidyl-prolyl cis-trans isomerase [Clostridia bacterium]
MKKAIRLTALILAGVIMIISIAGCSAYKHPEKYITVPEKGTVSVSQKELDEDYQEQIDSILSEYKETPYKLAEDPETHVTDGDKVNITFTGVPKSKEITDESILKGMTNADNEEGTDLVIGSGTFVGEYIGETDETTTQGFEEQLIGAKTGETVTVTVTFPDSYGTTELQGVVAEFTVKINSISQPLVNDKSTVSVSYTFELVNEEESDDTQTDAETPEVDADATTEGETETTGSGETVVDTGLDGEKKLFADLFVNASFMHDFTNPDEEDHDLTPFIKASEYYNSISSAKLNDIIEDVITVPESAGDDYKDYIGRKVKLQLKVESITVLPELTDEIIADYTSNEYTTIADFEEYVKKSILGDHAFEAIMAATTVNEYPSKELKNTYKSYVDQLVYSKLGKQPSEYTQKELDALISEEDYKSIYSQASNSAVNAVKQRLVMEYFFNYYDVKLTKDEYNAKLNEAFNAYAYYYIYYYGISDAKALEKYYTKEYFENQFKYEKLLTVISDYVNVTE